MKRFTLLLVLALGLSQCNILEKDSFPEPGDPISLDADNIVLSLNTGTSLINIPGLLSNDVKAGEVEYIKPPRFGTLTVANDKFLRYTPLEEKGDYEEEIIIKNPANPAEEIPVTIVVRSGSDDFCSVYQFEPTYLGVPLAYTVKQGESFETDLIDLFCDYQRGGSAGVIESYHPELRGDGFEIHISTQNAKLTFNPVGDYIGKHGIIYELCYDLSDEDCLKNEQFFDCPTYPQSCKYFLYTYVEIKVVE